MATPLPRVVHRPDPDQWRDDEPMTLAEAAAVFFPDGPLKVSSLRTAARRGELAYRKVAGKLLTTPGAIRAMTTPALQPVNRPQVDRATPSSPSRSAISDETRIALASALRACDDLKERSKRERDLKRAAALDKK